VTWRRGKNRRVVCHGCGSANLKSKKPMESLSIPQRLYGRADCPRRRSCEAAEQLVKSAGHSSHAECQDDALLCLSSATVFRAPCDTTLPPCASRARLAGNPGDLTENLSRPACYGQRLVMTEGRGPPSRTFYYDRTRLVEAVMKKESDECLGGELRRPLVSVFSRGMGSGTRKSPTPEVWRLATCDGLGGSKRARRAAHSPPVSTCGSGELLSSQSTASQDDGWCRPDCW